MCRSLLATLTCVVALATPAAAGASHPGLEAEFAAAGTTGTMVVHQTGHIRRTVVVGKRRSRQRFLPSSTFKVPNALIAIQTGVASGPDQRYPGPNPDFIVDGAPLLPPICEGDLTLTTALRNSCIPIFQRIARQVGIARYRTAVRDMDYGNRRVDSVPVDEFWLRGPFAISAREQVRFLDRLRTGGLPFSRRALDSVRQMLVTGTDGSATVRGKTGYVFSTPQRRGWWVGWVERPGQVSTFALNLDVNRPADLDARVAIGTRILRRLGAFGGAR